VARRPLYIPTGRGHDRHFHPAHWGYIVQGGTMRITTATGTVERVLKPATNWWSDGIDWHEPVNIGAQTAVYVIVEPKTSGK
jgi:beta-alanine degradation protein BauB